MNFNFLQVNSGDYCKTKVMLLEADLNTYIYSVHRPYTNGFDILWLSSKRKHEHCTQPAHHIASQEPSLIFYASNHGRVSSFKEYD